MGLTFASVSLRSCSACTSVSVFVSVIDTQLTVVTTLAGVHQSWHRDFDCAAKNARQGNTLPQMVWNVAGAKLSTSAVLVLPKPHLRYCGLPVGMLGEAKAVLKARRERAC